MPRAARGSRGRERRSEKTRRAILDAAVKCLLELGYAGTSTLEVQHRAGLSRGALLHHFPAKAELLAATVRHLAGKRGRKLDRQAARLPTGRARVGAALDLLWASFSDPLFYVAMELRTAARTDPELRAVLATVEVEVHDHIVQQSRDKLFGPRVASASGFERALDMTLQLMIGAAMTAILHHQGKPGRRGARSRRSPQSIDALIARWKSVFPKLLRAAPGGARSSAKPGPTQRPNRGK